VNILTRNVKKSNLLLKSTAGVPKNIHSDFTLRVPVTISNPTLTGQEVSHLII
jgi:hypothetical protein